MQFKYTSALFLKKPVFKLSMASVHQVFVRVLVFTILVILHSTFIKFPTHFHSPRMNALTTT